tara:strand:+ start:2538 stop:3116 length:579 start_codon:yes stop_codon:yes gene_type:complete
MAILRAGPDVQGRPVSCANDTSSSAWPWKYIKLVNVSIVTHTGCVSTPNGAEPVTTSTDSNDSTVETATGDFSISSSATSNHGTTVDIGFEFAYQATQSFNIKITYNGSVGGGPLPFFSSSGIEFFDNQDSSPITGLPSLSGSVTRTLPASVVPAVYSARLSAAVGIEFPDDICTPSSGSANASATLGLEFL